MKITIDPKAILPWLSLIGIVVGFIVKAVKSRYDLEKKIEAMSKEQKQHQEELNENIDRLLCRLSDTQKTQTQILTSLFASLEGMVEMGANGPVKKAKNDLANYLAERITDDK